MSKVLCSLVVLVALLAVSSCSTEPTTPTMPNRTKTFDGASADLKATSVVPTLKTVIDDGHNAVWCASFLAAWKSLSEDIAQAEISLEGSPQSSTLLNQADDPRPHVPTGSMYVATGWKHKGVIDRIRRELKVAFPAKQSPTFPRIAHDSFVAYSYLEANVKFTLPYFQNSKPLEFTDSGGRKTQVASFGIRSEDDYAYDNLRSQVRILFRKGSPYDSDSDFEFAVDLCADSSPSQIIVARINREPTLKAALQRLEKEEDAVRILKKKAPDDARYLETIGVSDVLLVPDFFWRITHRFSELEGRAFLNSNLKGQCLDVAQQDIVFWLDRSGADLKSESKMVCESDGIYFVLDRPFLIVMRKRGTTEPYFAMWVDNGELLTPWKQ